MTEELDFRGKIKGISNKALDIIDGYFDGKRHGTDKVKEAMKMVGFGVKVEHMNQLKDQNNRSVALRLLRWLPDDAARKRYIQITNPEIKQALLARPADGNS